MALTPPDPAQFAVAWTALLPLSSAEKKDPLKRAVLVQPGDTGYRLTVSDHNGYATALVAYASDEPASLGEDDHTPEGDPFVVTDTKGRILSGVQYAYALTKEASDDDDEVEYPVVDIRFERSRIDPMFVVEIVGRETVRAPLGDVDNFPDLELIRGKHEPVASQQVVLGEETAKRLAAAAKRISSPAILIAQGNEMTRWRAVGHHITIVGYTAF